MVMAIEYAAWPEEAGAMSEFINSRYILVKGGFNFSGIPFALTCILCVYMYVFIRYVHIYICTHTWPCIFIRS